MNTTTRISKAQRFGHWLGQGWRGYLRGERRAAGWLVTQGLPVPVATTLVWVVKLTVLAGLFYVAFWLALLLVLLFLVARGLATGTDDFPLPSEELRHGEAGFGLYSSDGHRLDPHDPNNPYDD